MVLAVVTGVGGGMIRDILLGATPVAAIQRELYLGVCPAVGLVVFLAADWRGSLCHQAWFLRDGSAHGGAVFMAGAVLIGADAVTWRRTIQIGLAAVTHERPSLLRDDPWSGPNEGESAGVGFQDELIVSRVSRIKSRLQGRRAKPG